MRAPSTTIRQSPAALACVGLLLLVAAWLWAGQGKGSAAVATVLSGLACAALIATPRERATWLPARVRALPRDLDVVPPLAALLSTPSYGLGWFHGANPFDEVVHLASGVLAGAVLAGLLLADEAPRRPRRLLAIGLLAGLPFAGTWEAFEWVVGMVGDAPDTLSDIALTAGGMALGAWGYARAAQR